MPRTFRASDPSFAVFGHDASLLRNSRLLRIIRYHNIAFDEQRHYDKGDLLYAVDSYFSSQRSNDDLPAWVVNQDYLRADFDTTPLACAEMRQLALIYKVGRNLYYVPCFKREDVVKWFKESIGRVRVQLEYEADRAQQAAKHKAEMAVLRAETRRQLHRPRCPTQAS
ncbi:hypothetical protein LTR17_003346 [Elasticomyces elasticus]|nr:hypothetical protein LTR17_003346 [Elasticomyces elasticus]